MFRVFLTLTFSCLISFSLFAESVVPPLADWTLSGPGKRISPEILEVTGTGKETSAWRSKPVRLRPGGYYRYAVSLTSPDADSGCLPCGVEGFSRDYSAKKGEWADHSFYFLSQGDRPETSFRVGQWESKGTYRFKNVKLETVVPVLKECDTPFGKLVLGDGESIRAGVYRFNGWLGGKATNIHRPYLSSNCTFNSNRWCLYANGNVVYRFRLENRSYNPVSSQLKGPEFFPFDGGTVKIGICYHHSGQGTVEVSRDGETRWTELGKVDKTGTHEFTLPPIAFPMEQIYLRIRGLDGSNFQVETVALEAPLAAWRHPKLDWKNCNATGETLFATHTGPAPKQADELTIGTDGKIRVREFVDEKTPPKEHVFPLKTSASPGEIEQKFTVGEREYTLKTSTHPLHRSDYGYAVAPNLWWCEADWKVSRTRPAPAPETKKPIEIFAAKNDVEGFQIVLRADDKPLTFQVSRRSDLVGPNGAVISGDNIELMQVYYHFVHSKTDGTGLVDYWPDALPPLGRSIRVEAGKNQPVWVNVKIPADAAPGKYGGFLLLQLEGDERIAAMDFTVHVWDFALPKENHHETAYGFSHGMANQYHNAKTEEDRRRVTDMYFQCFADHRISIYNPTPYDPIAVKWLPDKEDGTKSKCEIDFSRYDTEMARVQEKFHFTNFTVPGHGLGSGTFHERYEPSLAGFAADTPQYKAMMVDYYTKLVGHLKEKGWLKKAYVYWFDEPGKHDYQFVAAGTARLEHYAPELARMMTLMMKDRGFFEEMEKLGTTLNIWCPVSSGLDEELAKERMAKSERFWWYVCTGPKAPYCTLFIDHPATELRIWHWQAWQRGIVGSLIWQSNYWHSGTAFPGTFQNPYEDPMGYVSGYSTPPGTKRNWGNGDGRFIYPPLSAAVPGLNDGKPIFDKPVSSIRWAMIREGVEDYEMFYMLRELLKTKGSKLPDAERKAAEELLTVPDSITKTLTDFTIDPRPLLQRRKALGDTIEKLSNIR